MSQKSKKSNVREKLIYTVMTALFAAVITVVTAYLLHIPFGNGYFHIGDAFIFIAASMLPTPYAIGAAAVGAGLADILSGGAIWAPASIIIKSMIVLCFTGKDKKLINKRNILALLGAAVITCGGYYVYEGLLYHNWAAAVPGIVMNFLQVLISAIIFVVLGLALDSLKIKLKLVNEIKK